MNQKRKLSRLCGGRAAWALGACVALGFVSGCDHSAKVSASPAGRPSGQQYKLRGKVVLTDAGKSEVVVDHEAIPGFMMAMTMPYPVKDTAILSELHAGDMITADVMISEAGSGRSMWLDHIVVVGQARPDNLPKVQYHVPAPGDAVPDTPLLNQSGKKIRLSQFRGKVVVLTFVYTRCQMSNFCPQMSRNFAEMDKALASDPAAYRKTHLLSISFDPAYDTPAVLRSYGGAYTGRYTNETFAHWDFAAPSIVDLPHLEQFFDLGVTGTGVGIQHSLATVIVGKDGKVLAFYPGSDWKVDDVVKQVKAAAG